jgi:hypothetical protein
MSEKGESRKCINDLRKILDQFWQDASAKGRCWGITDKGKNPLAGSHIVLFFENEIVTIFQDRRSKIIKLKSYREVKISKLGKKIQEHLKKKDVII